MADDMESSFFFLILCVWVTAEAGCSLSCPALMFSMSRATSQSTQTITPTHAGSAALTPHCSSQKRRGEWQPPGFGIGADTWQGGANKQQFYLDSHEASAGCALWLNCAAGTNGSLPEHPRGLRKGPW